MIDKILIVGFDKRNEAKIEKLIGESIVDVKGIISAADKDEALDIMKEKDIDVMFVDVDSKAKKGIELIEHFSHERRRPITIVFSKEKDFEGAVKLFRLGSKDYIVKPFDQKKTDALLQEIDESLIYRSAARDTVLQRVSFMMFYDNITSEEVVNICDDFNNYMNFPSFCCFCVSSLKNPKDFTAPDKYIYIKGEEYLDIIVCDTRYKEEMKKKLRPYTVGMSTDFWDIYELKMSFYEALEMRKTAFLRCENLMEFAEFDHPEYEHDYASKRIMHTANLICSNKLSEAMEQLEMFIQGAKNKKYSVYEFEDQIHIVARTSLNIYRRMLGDKNNDVNEILDMYKFQNLDEYMEVLYQWINRFDELISDDAEEHMTIQKINDAVEYIKNNYTKDLNMAVVSNYISMNYSLFSYTFKQYVGINFVNYLKNIRIGEAKRLLTETDMKVQDVSKAVGYEHEKHFMKTFKVITGLTPTQYRKSFS